MVNLWIIYGFAQITIVIPRTADWSFSQPRASALPLAAWVGSVESGPLERARGARGARARPGRSQGSP